MDELGRQSPSIATFGALLRHLREDYAANRRPRNIRTFWTPGFQAVAAYRIGVWAQGQSRLIGAPVRLLIAVPTFFIRNVYGIELFPSATIGRRLRIINRHGIVIHARATIGDDCTIRQGVTIAAARLGHRVQVGVGTVVVAGVTIGDDVSIGPNAVVMTNVPKASIVAGPQSRVIAKPPRRPPVTESAPVRPDSADSAPTEEVAS